MNYKKIVAYWAALLVIALGIWACSDYAGREELKPSVSEFYTNTVSSSYFPISSISDFDSVVANGNTVLSLLSRSSLDSLRSSLLFNNGFLASYSYDGINSEFDDAQLHSFFTLFGMTLTTSEMSSARSAFNLSDGTFSFLDKDGSGKTSSVPYRCDYPDCLMSIWRVCIYANCTL